jgi:hypothetical protein
MVLLLIHPVPELNLVVGLFVACIRFDIVRHPHISNLAAGPQHGDDRPLVPVEVRAMMLECAKRLLRPTREVLDGMCQRETDNTRPRPRRPIRQNNLLLRSTVTMTNSTPRSTRRRHIDASMKPGMPVSAGKVWLRRCSSSLLRRLGEPNRGITSFPVLPILPIAPVRLSCSSRLSCLSRP